MRRTVAATMFVSVSFVVALQMYWLAASGARVASQMTTASAPKDDERAVISMPDTPRELARRYDNRGFIIEEAPWDSRILLEHNNPELHCALARSSRPRLVADDRGYLCTEWEVDPDTQCCRSRYRYSCLSCHNEAKCCAIYATCVTCCMRERLPFDECAGRCRTSTNSVLLDDAPLLRLVPHCWHSPERTPAAAGGFSTPMCASCERRRECCKASKSECVACCQLASRSNCTLQCDEVQTRRSPDVGDYRTHCSTANNYNSSDEDKVEWLDRL